MEHGTRQVIKAGWLAARLTPQRLRLSPIPTRRQREERGLHGAYGLDGISSELLPRKGERAAMRICLPCAHACRRSVEAAQGEQANDWRCSDRGARRPFRPVLLLAGPRSPLRSIACLSETRLTACMHAIEICVTTSIAAKKRFVCT